jgi:hypothetical protein
MESIVRTTVAPCERDREGEEGGNREGGRAGGREGGNREGEGGDGE